MSVETKQIKIMRRFHTFDLVEEEWTMDGINPMTMPTYRTKTGHYIAARHRKKRPGLIKAIARLDITPELSTKKHKVCSVGKSSVDGKWYGWSHRAMVGFGIGDKIFQENYNQRKLCVACKSGDINGTCEGGACPSSTPFAKHGKKTITTDAEARRAAVAFARYVS